MIVILLFNLLFRSFVVCGLQLFKCLRGSRGCFFRFQKHYRCGKSSAYVDFGCNGPLVAKSLDLARKSKNVLDSVALEFKLLTIKPVGPIFALKQTSCLPLNS